jgi:hypothetical protein
VVSQSAASKAVDASATVQADSSEVEVEEASDPVPETKEPEETEPEATDEAEAPDKDEPTEEAEPDASDDAPAPRSIFAKKSA